VTILACIYIAVGTAGFVYHWKDFQAKHGFQGDAIGIELTEILAVVCGGYMLSGQNWARWLALGWMALHVVVSIFHTVQEFAIHCLFCAAIGWLLFRPEAARYFRGARAREMK
jgi:hypothetical protein